MGRRINTHTECVGMKYSLRGISLRSGKFFAAKSCHYSLSHKISHLNSSAIRSLLGILLSHRCKMGYLRICCTLKKKMPYFSFFVFQVAVALKDCPFLSTSNSVAIMDGRDEGLFSWFTVNFLMGESKSRISHVYLLFGTNILLISCKINCLPLCPFINDWLKSMAASIIKNFNMRSNKSEIWTRIWNFDYCWL